ncbi:MAG: hypothetical protein JXA25_13650 [Anaerolineales bacterium]|nr:hypothetical protein [Anaerolineales bacterium]
MVLRSLLGFIINLVVLAVIAVLLVVFGVLYLLFIPFVGLPHHRRMQLRALLRQIWVLPARYRV